MTTTSTSPAPPAHDLRRPLRTTRHDITVDMTFIAALALSRAANLRIDHNPVVTGSAEGPPAELSTHGAVRDGSWGRTMRHTEQAIRRISAAVRAFYDDTIPVDASATAEQRDHYLDIRTRQAVELMRPAATAPRVGVACQGRPETAWTMFHAHPLAEVRAVARRLYELPTAPRAGRRNFPEATGSVNFDDLKTVKASREAARSAAALLDEREVKPESRTIPTVDVIRADPDATLTTAAAAIYEQARVPYAWILKDTRDRLSDDDRRSVALEAAGTRRWSEQPPAAALRLFRTEIEINACGLNWLALSATAVKAGAAVLLQPLGTAPGWVPPPEPIVQTGFAGAWDDRMAAHNELAARLEADGVPHEIRQYSLTPGHLCRGVLVATGDRLVRLVDWLCTQRSGGPHAEGLRRIGHLLFTKLTQTAPEASKALKFPRARG